MDRLYVIGSQQRRGYSADLNEWNAYHKGLIVQVDPVSGSTDVCVEYAPLSEEALTGEESPSIEFKAGTIQDGKLFVCTRTDVFVYQLPHFDRVDCISLPCFNDLHHAAPTPQGTILVVNTGLDMLLEMTIDGEVLREWNVLGEEPWERFCRDVDYRQISTTKPHHSHPNYVFQVDGEIWVTRFKQKDALCLTAPDRCIEIAVERPHDGVVFDGSVYFTTVNGYIVVAGLEHGQIERVINLNDITEISRFDQKTPLGWCRGLKVLDRDHVVVGFTKLRHTKWRENVRWIKRRFGFQAGTAPTRIALYNLKARKLCWEKNLQEEGMDTVFSIHNAE